MRYVIIGNGVAGITAADTIRRIDPEGHITFVAREAFPPYCRPMISNILAGSAELDELPIRSDDYYRSLGATAYLGVQATGLDLERREVSISAGANLPFDRLLIASGADPHRIEAENLDLENIFFMRTVKDVLGMVEALPKVKHALVLGGGLVGFKAAYGFLSRGIRVTMLIRSGFPLAMQIDQTAGEMIQAELERHGLEVRTGIEATGFEADEAGAVRAARLSDGSSLECDAVVVGKGVFPARGYVPPAIETDAGILVDDHMQTNVAGVYAAGDVAEHVDVARQRPWVNAIWPVAVEMGRVAGHNMAGYPMRYPGSLSRNVIRIFDLDVMTAGMVSPRESEGLESAERYDRRRNTYRKLLFREGALVGFVLVNQIEQGGVLMNLVHQGASLNGLTAEALGPRFNVGQVMGRGRKAGTGYSPPAVGAPSTRHTANAAAADSSAAVTTTTN